MDIIWGKKMCHLLPLYRSTPHYREVTARRPKDKGTRLVARNDVGVTYPVPTSNFPPLCLVSQSEDQTNDTDKSIAVSLMMDNGHRVRVPPVRRCRIRSHRMQLTSFSRDYASQRVPTGKPMDHEFTQVSMGRR